MLLEAIVAALEWVAANVTTNLLHMITPSAMTLIVREASRAALDEIVQRDTRATKRTKVEAEAARAGLEQEINRLKTAIRLRDGDVACQATARAMAALANPCAETGSSAVEREVLVTLFDVKLAELAYEEGMSLEQASSDIRRACRRGGRPRG